jgi:hypothetical protein
LPAGGQAPAVLADRKQSAQTNLERVGKKIQLGEIQTFACRI